MEDDNTFEDLQLALKDERELRGCQVSRDDNMVSLELYVWTSSALTELTRVVQRFGLQHKQVTKNKVIVYLS